MNRAPINRGVFLRLVDGVNVMTEGLLYQLSLRYLRRKKVLW